MRVYIAGTLTIRHLAEQARSLLEPRHVVVSSWHRDAEATVEAERRMGPYAKQGVAALCLSQVRQSQAVVVLVAPTERHGFAFEAGYAAGLGRELVVVPVLGGEPSLLFDGVISTCVDSIEALGWM